MTRDATEKIAVAAYRAGMKNGIREYAVWKDGERLVGVMRVPLRHVLRELGAVAEPELARCALSDQAVREIFDLATRGP